MIRGHPCHPENRPREGPPSGHQPHPCGGRSTYVAKQCISAPLQFQPGFPRHCVSFRHRL
jgi:hypothetical protein